MGDTPAEALPVLKHRLVEEINKSRAEAKLPPVSYAEDLSRVADEHCREMVREGYVSHWNRAGLKPYMRYTLAGITDATEENVWSLWKTDLDTSPEGLWREILAGHRSFLAEQPPNDGHRRSVLGPRHTHVGIGIAYDRQGLRLVEVFGARYAKLKALPQRVALKKTLELEGRRLDPRLDVFGVSLFFEPFPQPMTLEQLKATGAYGLPDEERLFRKRVFGEHYADGSVGTVLVFPDGLFLTPLRFWKGQPGSYTVAVWLREREKGEPFIGAMTTVFVGAEEKPPATPPLPRGPGAGARLPGGPASFGPGVPSALRRGG